MNHTNEPGQSLTWPKAFLYLGLAGLFVTVLLARPEVVVFVLVILFLIHML